MSRGDPRRLRLGLTWFVVFLILDPRSRAATRLRAHRLAKTPGPMKGARSHSTRSSYCPRAIGMVVVPLLTRHLRVDGGGGRAPRTLPIWPRFTRRAALMAPPGSWPRTSVVPSMRGHPTGAALGIFYQPQHVTTSGDGLPQIGLATAGHVPLSIVLAPQLLLLLLLNAPPPSARRKRHLSHPPGRGRTRAFRELLHQPTSQSWATARRQVCP